MRNPNATQLKKEARASKITEEDILYIRANYKAVRGHGSNAVELAQKYNLTTESIRNVAHRRTFSWV